MVVILISELIKLWINNKSSKNSIKFVQKNHIINQINNEIAITLVNLNNIDFRTVVSKSKFDKISSSLFNIDYIYQQNIFRFNKNFQQLYERMYLITYRFESLELYVVGNDLRVEHEVKYRDTSDENLKKIESKGIAYNSTRDELKKSIYNFAKSLNNFNF